ncbi:MAG: hypothetical protein LBN03_02650 [Bifidobacteriaceae bacterium]|jgi:hypothetical protein|nr:hypothetical protein [Bifidobacteriaceae bacterium]
MKNIKFKLYIFFLLIAICVPNIFGYELTGFHKWFINDPTRAYEIIFKYKFSLDIFVYFGWFISFITLLFGLLAFFAKENTRYLFLVLNLISFSVLSFVTGFTRYKIIIKPNTYIMFFDQHTKVDAINLGVTIAVIPFIIFFLIALTKHIIEQKYKKKLIKIGRKSTVISITLLEIAVVLLITLTPILEKIIN